MNVKFQTFIDGKQLLTNVLFLSKLHSSLTELTAFVLYVLFNCVDDYLVTCRLTLLVMQFNAEEPTLTGLTQ